MLWRDDIVDSPDGFSFTSAKLLSDVNNERIHIMNNPVWHLLTDSYSQRFIGGVGATTLLRPLLSRLILCPRLHVRL